MSDDPSSSSIDKPNLSIKAYPGDKPFIFVAYSHKDQLKVNPDLHWLHAQGYRLWLDEGHHEDSERRAHIHRALDRCAFFLAFLSPRAIESKVVRQEINYALDHRKPFLAVHLEKTQLTHGLAPRIGDLPALYRHTLSDELYHRRFERALPAAVKGPPPSPTPAAALDFPDESHHAHEPIKAASPDALSPTKAHLLELQGDGRFRPLELRKAFYTVGRLDVLVTLEDKRVSRRHLVLARVGPDWIALNVSPSKKMWVAGWELRQKTLRDGDVIRIGETWLVFAASRTASDRRDLKRMKQVAPAPPTSVAADPDGVADPVLIGQDLPALPQPGDSCRVRIGTETVTTSDSVDRPLLMGTHPLCEVRVAGPGVAPFHCFVTWVPEGLGLFDLDSGSGTTVDGQPVRVALLRDGQTIGVGKAKLPVSIAGDRKEPGRKRQPRPPRRMALTAVNGPHKNETALLDVNQTSVLGSSEPAEMLLPREVLLSPRHVQFKVKPEGDESGRLLLLVQPESDACRVWVNGDRVKEEAVARPGDVIHFSPSAKVTGTALLVHYDTRDHVS